MFKLSHEYSFELSIPLHQAWTFSTNTDNWPQWMDPIEACILEGDFKVGSTVKGKIKNRNLYLNTLITEVNPYRSFKLLAKMSLMTQENHVTFQELSPGRTSIKSTIYVTSIFVPFMRSYLRKKGDEQCAACLRFLEKTYSNINAKTSRSNS